MALHPIDKGTGISKDLPNTPDVLIHKIPICRNMKFLVDSFTEDKGITLSQSKEHLER